MKNIFFRTTSLWASVLYMALGLVLTFWPGMSGTVFCWGIAAALILYAAHSFWYFIKARNLGFTAGGTLVIGILCLAFGIFCFSRPYVVLSFLPIALGIMLLVDGIGKCHSPLMPSRCTAPTASGYSSPPYCRSFSASCCS